jgi:hypothetical protein
MAGVVAQQPMASQREEVAGLGLGLGGERCELLLVERLWPQLIKQLVQRALVVAGALELWQLLQKLGQKLAVVAGQVVGAVVDQDDALGLLVVYVDVRDRQLLPAQLAGGQERVVAGQNLAGAPAGHHRAVLAVALKALLDRRQIPSAGVAPVGAQVPDRYEQVIDGLRCHRGRLSDRRGVLNIRRWEHPERLAALHRRARVGARETRDIRGPGSVAQQSRARRDRGGMPCDLGQRHSMVFKTTCPPSWDTSATHVWKAVSVALLENRCIAEYPGRDSNPQAPKGNGF